MKAADLVRMETLYQEYGENQTWKQPFRQATFYNFGDNTVTINSFPVPAGTFHKIDLKHGEVNSTKYRLVFGAGVTSLWIVFSVYADVANNQ